MTNKRGDASDSVSNTILEELLNITANKYNQTNSITKDSKPSIGKSTLETIQKDTNQLKESQEKHSKEIFSLKALVSGGLVLLIGTVVIWFIDTFYIYQGVKEDYIIQTKEIENKIELFEKDIEKIKSDIIYDIEDNNNEIANIEKRIEKEVELQLSKKIIELKLNINN